MAPMSQGFNLSLVSVAMLSLGNAVSVYMTFWFRFPA